MEHRGVTHSTLSPSHCVALSVCCLLLLKHDLGKLLRSAEDAPDARALRWSSSIIDGSAHTASRTQARKHGEVSMCHSHNIVSERKDGIVVVCRVVVLMRVHSAEQKRRADVAPCACSTVLPASAERYRLIHPLRWPKAQTGAAKALEGRTA